MNISLRQVSLRSLRVWQRNQEVYFRTWQTNMLPPLLEPILYLLAFGAGVGALVKQVNYQGEVLGYSTFIAPGLLATQVMFQAFFETTYSTFVRMYYQKTFEGIVTTPLSLEDIMAGELLWGATKATVCAAIMLIAISFFGLIEYPSGLVVLPFAVLSGLCFSGMGLCFTAITPRIDQFNFSTFLLILPMFLFSGTFFPLDVLPKWGQTLAQCLPLTHVTHIMRAATLNRFSPELGWSFLYLAALTVPLFWLGIVLMRKRLLK